MHSSRESAAAFSKESVSASKGAKTSRTGGLAFEYVHKAVALGTLYAINKGLYRVCAAASIKFPSPLIGELSILHIDVSCSSYTVKLVFACLVLLTYM